MKFFKNSNSEVKGWRRLGRTIGALPVIIIAYNLLFALLLQPEENRFEDIKTIVILLSSAVLLYLVAWIFEVVGGILLIINSIALIVYFIVLSPGGQLNSNAIALYALPFTVCGMIALYCAWKDRIVLDKGAKV